MGRYHLILKLKIAACWLNPNLNSKCISNSNSKMHLICIHLSLINIIHEINLYRFISTWKVCNEFVKHMIRPLRNVYMCCGLQYSTHFPKILMSGHTLNATIAQSQTTRTHFANAYCHEQLLDLKKKKSLCQESGQKSNVLTIFLNFLFRFLISVRQMCVIILTDRSRAYSGWAR